MKCKECGKETTWDTSYGKEKYLICSKCFDKKVKEYGDVLIALKKVFEKG